MSGNHRRRDVLRGVSGFALGAWAAGCLATGEEETTTTTEPTTTTTTTTATSFDYGGWFEDVENFSGTNDLTGRPMAVVDVGTPANGGDYGYGPPAIHIDPDTKVEFRWDATGHNVVIEEKPTVSDWQGFPLFKEQLGVEEHTFEVEGMYKYFCERHSDRGMKGAIVVGDPEA